jgi:hypothetical protein
MRQAKEVSRQGAKAQRKTLDTRQNFLCAFAPLRESIAAIHSVSLLTTLCIPSRINSTLKLISRPSRLSINRK